MPGLLRRHGARQNARADQEQAFLPEQPQTIEKLFIGIGVFEGRRQPRRQFALVRHGAEEARIDEPVHDLRLPRQHVTQTRRRAEYERHQRDEIAVLAEQRDQPAAALQRLQKAIERDDRKIWLLGIGQPDDQRRHEFHECLPRALIFERAIIIRHPVLHRLRHHGRLAETELGEMFEQSLIRRARFIVDRRKMDVIGGSPSNRRP